MSFAYHKQHTVHTCSTGSRRISWLPWQSKPYSSVGLVRSLSATRCQLEFQCLARHSGWQPPGHIL